MSSRKEKSSGSRKDSKASSTDQKMAIPTTFEQGILPDSSKIQKQFLSFQSAFDLGGILGNGASENAPGHVLVATGHNDPGTRDRLSIGPALSHDSGIPLKITGGLGHRWSWGRVRCAWVAAKSAPLWPFPVAETRTRDDAGDKADWALDI
jgi:hypothetical protein